MFCRCPHCNKQRQVSAKQLRDSRGLLKCKRCGESFDALSSLSEQASDRIKQNDDFIYRQPKPKVPARIWNIGSATLVLLLIAQILYFDAWRLYGQPTIHRALSQTCQALNCRLPVLINPDEWTVSHSDLQPYLAGRYWLTAALTNQAQIIQAYPKLILTLTDFNGQSMAERVIVPKQYTEQTELAANETVQISLPLMITAGDVGGFTLTTL